jgi:hypothetical protein
MKIERSAEILTQLHEATTLQKKLILVLTQALGDGSNPIGKGTAKNEEPAHPCIQTLELSAEGFKPVLVPVQVGELDRTESMMAGPFFTSADYPIPSTSKGMLLPVVQLDLRNIHLLNGHDLGDGLLQLWCDPDWQSDDRGRVIVIPREEISTQVLTPFVYEAHPNAYESPVSSDWVFDPKVTEVQVISAFESIGLQCQSDCLTVDLPEDILDSVADDIQKFSELTEFGSTLHLLGSFHTIQYSALDFGWNCLINFPSWGCEGSAQIFYLLTEQGMAFSFNEALR